MQAEDIQVGLVGHDVVSGASRVANGQAITLHQAAELFLGEELKSLSGKEQGVLPTESLEHQDSRDPAVVAEAAGPNYALMVWQKAGRSQRDEDGRLYGETGQGEEIQRDAGPYVVARRLVAARQTESDHLRRQRQGQPHPRGARR